MRELKFRPRDKFNKMAGWNGKRKLNVDKYILYEVWQISGKSQAAVARLFGISRQRASVIINKYRGG